MWNWRAPIRSVLLSNTGNHGYITTWRDVTGFITARSVLSNVTSRCSVSSSGGYLWCACDRYFVLSESRCRWGWMVWKRFIWFWKSKLLTWLRQWCTLTCKHQALNISHIFIDASPRLAIWTWTYCGLKGTGNSAIRCGTQRGKEHLKYYRDICQDYMCSETFSLIFSACSLSIIMHYECGNSRSRSIFNLIKIIISIAMNHYIHTPVGLHWCN